MNNSICSSCMNREICGKQKTLQCDHFDIALTRSEIFNIPDDVKVKNPSFIPSILGAVKKAYRINISY